jgi:hypothetical protein
MDDEEFEAELRAQQDYLRSQLEALAKRSRKVRQRFIKHEIWCAGCDSLVLQVMDLDPYRVIRYRDTQPHEQVPPVDIHPAERARIHSRRKPSLRLDDAWKFIPIGDEAESDKSPVFAACVCTRRHTFTVAGILARAGRRSTVKPAH